MLTILGSIVDIIVCGEGSSLYHFEILKCLQLSPIYIVCNSNQSYEGSHQNNEIYYYDGGGHIQL